MSSGGVRHKLAHGECEERSVRHVSNHEAGQERCGVLEQQVTIPLCMVDIDAICLQVIQERIMMRRSDYEDNSLPAREALCGEHPQGLHEHVVV